EGRHHRPDTALPPITVQRTDYLAARIKDGSGDDDRHAHQALRAHYHLGRLLPERLLLRQQTIEHLRAWLPFVGRRRRDLGSESPHPHFLGVGSEFPRSADRLGLPIAVRPEEDAACIK